MCVIKNLKQPKKGQEEHMKCNNFEGEIAICDNHKKRRLLIHVVFVIIFHIILLLLHFIIFFLWIFLCFIQLHFLCFFKCKKHLQLTSKTLQFTFPLKLYYFY